MSFRSNRLRNKLFYHGFLHLVISYLAAMPHPLHMPVSGINVRTDRRLYERLAATEQVCLSHNMCSCTRSIPDNIVIRSV